MKKLIFLVIMSVLIFSCSTAKKSFSHLDEDNLFVTRKYIGNFVDYCHTGPEICGGTDLIWIKTSINNNYGNISAYGNTCDFSAGDKIYLNSTYSALGKSGEWEYEIGNDSSVYYRLSDFRFENKSFVRSWSQ